jgi:hypothetical protein
VLRYQPDLFIINCFQCNEVKPVCGRCEKGLRECTYPPPCKKGKPKNRVEKKEEIEERPSTSGSESSLNSDHSDTEFEKPIVRFSSSASSGSPATDSSPNHFNSLDFDPQMLIDPIDSPPESSESLFSTTNPLLTLGVSPPSFCETLLLQTSTSSLSTSSTGPIHIPRPPRATRNQNVQFFLHFHRETVTEFHYFRQYDYHELCTKTLLAMAEKSDTLRHSVVAFSALIYSMKIDRAAREQAFLYYSMSLQQLRVLLDDDPTTTEEKHIAIAIALQLSSFDVRSIPIYH